MAGVSRQPAAEAALKLSALHAAREAGDVIAIIDGPSRLTWRDVAERLRAQTQPNRSTRELAPTIDTTSVLTLLSAVTDQVGLVLRHPKRPRSRSATPMVPRGSVALESSGTTAHPKLVVHRREALLAHAQASAEALGSIEGDRWLVCLPLAHVSGFAPIIRALASRRGVILERTFSPAKLELSVVTNRATLVSVVPAMLDDLVANSWRPPSHVRHVLVGGARCSPMLLERARSLGIPVRVAYGMTETFSHVALDGVPLVDVETRLTDNGVLEICAPMATTWPEWLDTGDHASIASDGVITILGRADEMIITGGENVSPATVENALRQQPGVRDAAVIGLDDDHWGQIVAAVVVADPSLDREALDAALRERLASFERPRRLALVRELPRSRTGKIDRAALLGLF